jgi:hypothetical protein
MKKTSILLSLALSLSISTSAIASNITSFSEDFSSSLSDKFLTSTAFSVIDGKLISTGNGQLIVDPTKFNNSNHYDLSMNFGDKGSQALVFGYKDPQSSFYTAKVRAGLYGFITVHKHANMTDGAGIEVFKSSAPVTNNVFEHQLKVQVKNKNIRLYLNNYLEGQLVISPSHAYNGVGLHAIYNQNSDYYVDNFVVNNHEEFTDSFIDDIATTWDNQGNYSISEQGLYATGNGQLISGDSFLTEGYYGAEMSWESPSSVSHGLILKFTDMNSPYLSARIKPGIYGGVYIYKHTSSTDGGGTLIDKILYDNNQDAPQILNARVEGDVIKLFANGELKLTYVDTDNLQGNKVGIQTLGLNSDSFVNYFTITR